MEIKEAIFSLMSSTDVFPEVATIIDALAANPNIALMGPYSAGDSITEGVKSRKIVPAPHLLGGLWFLKEEGITWQKFLVTSTL